MNRFYTITELTREFGISTRTLRYYEDEGLIQPERRGRTRLYRSADRHLIQEILRGRRVGCSDRAHQSRSHRDRAQWRQAADRMA